MNDNNDRNLNARTDEIDLVDFSANSEMQRIRENEKIEREKRMKRAAELRRAEMIKRKKIERIKQTVTAWAILVLGVVALVAVVSGVVSLFDKEDAPVLDDVGDKVSSGETKLVLAFDESDAIVYGKDKAQKLNALANDLAKSVSDEALVTLTSEYSILSDAYAWNDGFGKKQLLTEYVLSCPIFSNGYVWSSPKNMKSPITADGYLYDTNAAFINAVYDICLWEGDASFLDELDTASEAKGDISGGMTVKEKLEAAANYYFNDKDPNGGGIRYGFTYEVKNGVLGTLRKDDGLVYISTKENLGTPTGHASNLFSTYKFGYLDLYNNLVFCDAMNSLSKIYEMLEDTQKSEYYASVSQASKKAINNTFFDSEKGRYIGYIDIEGNKYDLGFTALNLLAVTLDVADKEKADSICAWLGGETKIGTDDLDSKEILSGTLTSFSTVSANDTTWDNIGGKYLLSAGASFGNSWLNGGKSALSTAYNVELQNRLGKDKLTALVTKLCDAHSKGNLVSSAPSETDEPKLYYSLLASKALKAYFGVSTDGKTLTVNPVFGTAYDIGIKGISFMGRRYDVLYDKSNVYVLCNINAPVRLSLGGFEPNEKLTLTIVDSQLISSTEPVSADKDGFVTISKKIGNTSYIKLESK